MATNVMTISTQEGLQAIGHPMRVAILGALESAGSAADVARRLDQQRQKVNYHLKSLEEAGLVVAVESRQKGNFMETVYEATARSFVVAPEVAWGDDRRAVALRSQLSLETLVEQGARLQRNAAELLDRAAFDGETIASASVSAEVAFADETARSAFIRDYLELTKKLIESHSGSGGGSYTVELAVHPTTERS